MLVLVVEDDAIGALSLTSEIEWAGHATLGPARTSGEAITLAREHRPALAFVDINLESGEAGVGLARLLKELSIPVIFATAHAHLARSNADCAIGLITKPYDPAEVPDILRYAESVLHDQNPLAPPFLLSFEVFERKRTR